MKSGLMDRPNPKPIFMAKSVHLATTMRHTQYGVDFPTPLRMFMFLLTLRSSLSHIVYQLLYIGHSYPTPSHSDSIYNLFIYLKQTPKKLL